MPFAVILGEVNFCEVAQDTGHCYRAIAPWWAEREVEFVVLDILIALNTSLIPYELMRNAMAIGTDSRYLHYHQQDVEQQLWQLRVFQPHIIFC